jgi:glycosyltransferase involved in cell wall biosynthesis
MSESPLHVVMVSRRVHPAHGPGGMERKVFDLAVRLAGSGVGVELFTETPADPERAIAASEAMPEGVVLNWVPGRWLPIGDRTGTVVLDRITNYPVWARRAARWVRDSRDGPPTVVHAHGLAAWGFVGLDAGTPLVMSVEGLEEFEVPGGLKHLAYAPFRRRMRRAAAVADVIISTDRALQPVVEKHLGIAAADQVMIPNAVDPAACRAMGDVQRGHRLLAERRIEGSAPLFFSVGRLEANKGFGVLVEALAAAAPRLPDTWAWVLVGDGPLRSTIEEAARAAGIAQHTVLAGRLSDADLHSVASVADWFVHPTLYEGSSLVTLEAMAHGLPVIASNAGGLPDKVLDGESGFLVPPGDASALADALARSVGVDGAAMGEAGRRRCEEVFSWQTVIDRYIEVYRAAAAAHAS